MLTRCASHFKWVSKLSFTARSLKALPVSRLKLLFSTQTGLQDRIEDRDSNLQKTIVFPQPKNPDLKDKAIVHALILSTIADYNPFKSEKSQYKFMIDELLALGNHPLLKHLKVREDTIH